MASVTVLFGGQEQKVHQLDRPKMVVGREPTCEICIDNLGISRQHCAFAVKGDAFIVQDMGSANGTYVNGKKVVEHYLNDGDEIVLGKYVLRFKNETQKASAPERDTSVPDTLNTYVMDGAKIQEQLAKMRAAQGTPAAAPGQPAMPPAGGTAKDYAKALDVSPPAAAPSESVGTLKTLLIVVIVAIVVLVVAVGVIAFYLVSKK